MEVERYLSRIGYEGSRAPSVAALFALQQVHLQAVPFENLDIHEGREIRLGEDALLEKIVARGRGGFCYELNGLFAALLTSLGYDVSLLSARVYGESGLSPEYDHMTLMVELEGRWLVDVGFGEGFVSPLSLDDEGPVQQRHHEYRVTHDAERFVYAARSEGEAWAPEFAFTLRPRSLSEFEERCRYHQTSPQSHFTRKRVISRLTETGRITLRDRTLLVTEGRSRTESPIDDDAAWSAALIRYFGVRL